MNQMFKDLRSKALIKKYEKEEHERAAKEKLEEERRIEAIKLFYKDGFPWAKIESCPFEAYLHKGYSAAGCILVTDMESVALASISKRFGRPIKVVKAPEPAITDYGLQYIGGEYEEYDHPQWWFDYELTDEFGSMTYAGGEETGKEEIGFLATHWAPLPILP